MTPDSSRIKQQLDTLYYDTGKQACNFEIAIAYRDDDNEQKWSKWRPYLDAQADEKFITRVNNRTILDIEIVLDVDPTEDESKESIKQRYEAIIHSLDKLGLRYKAYFSGSRGYHIHLLFPELRSLSQEVRKQVKELVIKKYDCDMQKASEKCMIALEDALHWKTGNQKELLKEILGKNSLAQLPEVQQYLAELEEEQQEEALKQQIFQQVKDNVSDSHIYYTNQFADYELLKEIARRHYTETNNLNFLVGAKTEVMGKITNKVFDHPVKIRLCWVASRELKEGEVRKIFFLDDAYDGRKWTKESEVSHDFWIYCLIANKKKYWVFSDKELNLEEYTVEGMLVECDDFAKIGMNKRIRTLIPFIFISETRTHIIRYQNHQELIGDVAKLHLTEDKLFNFLFSKNDDKSYRHPPHFERLVGSFLFSAARTKGDYPLHLLIIAKQGTGKTFMLEALDTKMREQQAIIEGSGITIKKLVPSFKDVIAEPGAFARGVRVVIVDEFLRVLIRSRPEDRENQLTMLNPLLEHKHREFGSGNSSITVKPTAKLLAVSNPVYGTNNMISLCEKFDNSFISRMLIVYQHEDHIRWVQNEKGIQEHTFTIPHHTWIGIYDYMQTFICTYDQERVREIFSRFEQFLADNVLDIYARRYKQHHIHLLMDGIIKTRCLVTGDASFAATDEDYNTLLTIWRTMILGWKGTNDISRLPSIKEKLRYVTREQHYLLDELKKRGRIRDTEVYNLECRDPTFHMIGLQEMDIVRREGHYFMINDQSELKDYESI